MFPVQMILQPTDFSPQSDNAFLLACQLARETHARLVVLHVAGAHDSPAEVELLRERLHRLRPDDPNILVEHQLCEGDAAEEILRRASVPDCDLVVLGTHGRTGLERLLLGSVAEHVVRGAPCPVLIVKEERSGKSVTAQLMERKADRTLQRDVLEELHDDPSVDARKINVEAHGGVVTLNGSVPVYHQKFDAENAAKRVHGVHAVVNDIDVQIDGAGRRSDTEIAEAALHALRWDAEVPEQKIRVTVRDGWITLEGVVSHPHQREAADRAVRRLTGARGVSNSIVVSPVAKQTDVPGRIEAALRRSALIDGQRVQVEASDDTIVLRGEAASWAERQEAERIAWAAPGVGRVDNQLLVTDPAASASER